MFLHACSAVSCVERLVYECVNNDAILKYYKYIVLLPENSFHIGSNACTAVPNGTRTIWACGQQTSFCQNHDKMPFSTLHVHAYMLQGRGLRPFLECYFTGLQTGAYGN